MLQLLQKLRPWMIAAFLSLAVSLVIIVINGNDPLALVTIGTQFSEGIPEEQNGTEGYDGQFNYYIARDPSTAAQYIDVPAYRFQRILMPGIAWVLSFGNVTLIPWIFLFIGVLSLAAGTAILEDLLVQLGASRWYALTYGLTIGTLGAVRLSLSEPLAYALALGGIWLFLHPRWWLSAIAFALALLTRETTILIPLACGIYLLTQRNWKIAIPFGLLTLIPFVAWQLILYMYLGQFGIGSGGAKATGFEIIPFMGVIRIVTDVPAEIRLRMVLIFGSLLLPFVLIPTFWALWRCIQDFLKGTVSFYTWLLVTHVVIMFFVPFSTYREPIGIYRFIVGLQIAIILYAAERHQKRALLYSTLWIITSFFLFSLA